MSLWLSSTIPATYNGLPIEIENTSGAKEFNLAEDNPIGFTESSIQPMGAKGRTINIRAVFPAQYFEAHKVFMQLLDATVIPLAPGVLTHPVWGPITVYPQSYTPTIEAAEKTAVVEVVFKRHFTTPEVIAPSGPFVLTPWLGESVPASVSGFLSMLAFLASLVALVLAAGLMFVFAANLASGVLRALRSAPAAWSAALGAIMEGLVVGWAEALDPREADPSAAESPPDAFARDMAERADAQTARFLAAANVSGAVIEATADGSADYDAGPFADGTPPTPARPAPPPRLHAALVICAAWEAESAGFAAARLARILNRQATANALDGPSADAAVVFARRRLARAHRLAAAAFGVHAAPTLRALSFQGAQLLKILEGVRIPRALGTRMVTIERPRPLMVIALDELGDASRAGEIRDLNPHLLCDFNRLPRGTQLRVPA